jgi:hypothetical protein
MRQRVSLAGGGDEGLMMGSGPAELLHRQESWTKAVNTGRLLLGLSIPIAVPPVKDFSHIEHKFRITNSNFANLGAVGA